MQTRTFDVQVKACPDAVWAALTDPEQTRRFFFGLTVHSDWQTGSTIVYRGAPPHQIIGEIVLAMRPNLLVHSIVDGPATCGDIDPLVWVTWTIERVDAGGSRISLLVEDFDDVADLELDHVWRQVLRDLSVHLDGARRPTPRSPSA
jgi:uncharacterized protein YndB with AHSA1/START domain